MERRALVAEALLAGAESSEVLGGLGNLFVEEVEVDAALLDCSRAVRSFVAMVASRVGSRGGQKVERKAN